MNPMLNQLTNTNNPMCDLLNLEQQRIQREEKAYREAKAAIHFAKHQVEALTPQQKRKLLNELINDVKMEYAFNYLNQPHQNWLRQ